MKILGLKTCLWTSDLRNVYIHKRECLDYDIERGTNLAEMMDYFIGDKIGEHRERHDLGLKPLAQDVEALIDGKSDDPQSQGVQRDHVHLNVQQHPITSHSPETDAYDFRAGDSQHVGHRCRGSRGSLAVSV